MNYSALLLKGNCWYFEWLL